MKKLLLVAVATLSFAFAQDTATASRIFGYRLGEVASEAYGLDIEVLLDGYQDFVDHKPFPITPSSDAQVDDAAEIGFTALGYIIAQTCDLILNAHHPSILQGMQDALAGEDAPEKDDALIYTLFKPNYRQLAQNLQVAIPFLTQLVNED